MSRTQSQGISYFPFAVDFFSDNKVKILKARYGNDGIAIYIYLLCCIYREGYYTRVNEDLEFIISTDLGISLGTVQQVMTFLLKRSMFDDKLFKSDNILTSDGIQERWQDAIKTRAAKRPIEVGKYWLLRQDKTIPHIKVTVLTPSSENYDFNSENYRNKVKESKVKDITSSSPPISPNGDGALKTIPIKETAIAFRRFVEEFNLVVIPNTDLSVFTLEVLQVLTDKFRRISWLGDEPHDTKWVAERAEQIINGVYDYSIDRDYTVYQEVDEYGEVKDVVSYTDIEKPPKRKAKSRTSTKQEQRKEQDDMIFEVLGNVWRDGKRERGELNDDE